MQQVVREGDGEDDGDGIVQARLELERRADPALELEAAAAEHREHRRGVRGRHHRAEHERLGPGEAPEVRRYRDDRRREHDADRGEQTGRGPGAAQRRERGVEAAVEQDQRQRERAEPEREPVVLEGDAADPLGARQHADDEEQERDRHPDPVGGPAEQDARRHEGAGDGQQQGGAERLARGHGSSILVPCRTRASLPFCR
jgi:hypothetical protein